MIGWALFILTIVVVDALVRAHGRRITEDARRRLFYGNTVPTDIDDNR
jgi:hypothetical protein